jgi:hypothetical protein
MKSYKTNVGLVGTVLLASLVLAGCASSVSDKPLPKAWRQANEFEDSPRVIPLFRPYVYQVMPVDRTLMQLIRRWGKDTKISDDYKCPDDFTLPKSLLEKSFTTLDQAIAQVNETYRLFGVKLTLANQNQFLVECVNRDVLTGVVRIPQAEEPKPQPVAPIVLPVAEPEKK